MEKLFELQWIGKKVGDEELHPIPNLEVFDTFDSRFFGLESIR
jgi:hypothetical protein